MTVLVTADLHFSANPRDAYRHAFMDRLHKMLGTYDVQHLLILGDLTEEKDKHGSWLTNQVVDHVRALSECCPVTILQGNHDAVDPAYPFFQFLKYVGYHDVQWVGSPILKDLPDLGKCCFLPHTNNPDRDWSGIKKSFRDCSYIFAHATFAGVKVGAGRELDGTPTSLFPKDARVIAGDIHAPVKVGCVEYVGAPYLVDFGDDYEPRVLLLDGDEPPRSVKCPGPQKRLIVVDDVEDLPGMLEEGHTGDVLRVRVRLDREQLHGSWPTIKDAVKRLCDEAGCALNSVQPIFTDPDPISKTPVCASGSRLEDSELVQNYCERLGAPNRVLDIGKQFL
jgi:hypothetical protein